jgi:hypothetical protein
MTKLQLGDHVTVNPAAFDEQIERILNPDAVLQVIDVNDHAPVGSSGQWVRLRGKIRAQMHSGETYTKGEDWIDSAWCTKV